MLDKLIDEPVSLSYLSTVNLVGVISEGDMLEEVERFISAWWRKCRDQSVSAMKVNVLGTL